MATVNKNFKIKSGLVVEGATGTINGHNILTESQDGIDFIVNQIGGTATPNNTPDTVVKRDGSGNFAAQTVTVEVLDVSGVGTISDDGELLIAAATGEDIRLTADDIRMESVDDIRMTAQGDILLDASQPGMGVYVGSIDPGNTVVTESIMDAHIGDNTVDGTAGNTVYDRIFNAKSEAISAASDDATTKANAAQAAAELTASNALSSAVTSLEGQISDAETAANSYTDTAITNLNLGTTYDAYGAAAQALSDAEDYTDAAVANLVDGAPALLDTLNELAAAIADNPNYATDVANLVAGKQDALTAGSNIDITSNVISVTGLDSADISDFNTAALSATSAAYDAAGSALTAENNAKSYADGLAVNYDPAGSASTAQSNAETFATNAINALDTDDIEEGTTNLYFTNQRAIDAVGGTVTDAINALDTDDIEEGTSNLYFTDQRARDAVANDISSAVAAGDITATPEYLAVNLADIAKQVAAQVSVPTASEVTAFSWASANYRSAEFLVKVAYGTHTEVSKVILTMDTSDNIAITEYAIVGTNGSASTISADVSGSDVRLRVTTVNNNSTVTVAGTLLV